jgi:hypothetical protein
LGAPAEREAATMTTTHDDNATTWRELADALTPQQIAYIEDWERRPDIPPLADGSAKTDDAHQRALLFTAREFVGSNAAASLFADIAPPPEEGHHYPWENIGDDTWTRFFVGTSRKLGDVEVFISGIQSSDGAISRAIGVSAGEDMGATEARHLAALLIEAADELDGWAGR